MISASLIMICLIACDDPKNPGNRPTPEQRYQALVGPFEANYAALQKASEKARTAEDARKLAPLLEQANPKACAIGLLALAEEYPGSKVAEDALIWICTHNTFLTRAGDEALRRLTRDHARSTKLGPVLALQGRMPLFFESTEAFFRAVLAQNTGREIQGLGSYWLARHLLYKSQCVRVARQRPNFGIIGGVDPYKEVLAPGWQDRLRKLDPDVMNSEAEELLARVVRFYADVPHNDPKSRPGTLGDAAKSYLHERRELAVGKPAPEIEATDLDGRAFRLSEYRGRVVVLDFGSHFYCGACRQMYPQMRGADRAPSGASFRRRQHQRRAGEEPRRAQGGLVGRGQHLALRVRRHLGGTHPENLEYPAVPDHLHHRRPGTNPAQGPPRPGS